MKPSPRDKRLLREIFGGTGDPPDLSVRFGPPDLSPSQKIEAKLNDQERLLDKQKSLHAELRASLMLEKLAPGCFDHGKAKVLYIPGPYKKYPWNLERHVDVAVIRGDGHRIDLPRGTYEQLGSPELNFQKRDRQGRTR